MLQTSILIADENEVQHTSSVRADGIKIKDEVENDLSMMFDIEEDQAQPEYKGSNELLMQQMSPLQRQLHLIFVQPRTLPAKVFIHTCSFFILVYTMMALFETMPQYNMSDGRSYLSDYFFIPKIIISICWITELAGRWMASTDKRKFFLRFNNVVDLLAILPLPLIFIESHGAESAGLAFMVLRLLKITRIIGYSAGIRIGLRAIRRSSDAVYMLLMYLLVVQLFLSTAIFWAERGEWNTAKGYWARSDGSRSPFNSIPEGFYWAITTLATVGYGDVVPITPAGKFIACIAMVASIMTIALPTSIIGANFMTEWQVQQRLQVQQKMRRKQRKLQSSNHLNTSGKFDEHRQHAFDYKLLMEQNGVMLSSIAEIQEKLNDINPPHYYIRFKECHAQCEFLHKRIAALEKQLAGYHEQDQQQKSQNAVAEHNSIHSTRNYSGHGPSFLQRIRERALYNTHHISECDESATEDHTPPLKRRRKSLTTWIKQHIRMSTYSDHSAAAVAGRFPLGWHPKSSIPPAPLKQLKRSYSLPDSFNNRHTRHNHQNHTEIEQTLTPHNSARPFSYA